MILTGAHGSTRTAICPFVVLFTTNPTWAGVAEENRRIEHNGRRRKQSMEKKLYT